MMTSQLSHPQETDVPDGEAPVEFRAPAAVSDEEVLHIEEEEAPWHMVNFVLIGVGLVMMAVGFVLLWQVDSRATNWQSIWAPLLILFSYAIIFVGVLIVRHPEKDEPVEPGGGAPPTLNDKDA